MELERAPYLVQRGKIKSPADLSSTFGKNVDLDYMGSSEFEFGATAQSLRRITKDLSRLTSVRHQVVPTAPVTITIDTYEGKGKRKKWVETKKPITIGDLFVVGDKDKVAAYLPFIGKIWNGELRMKERAKFQDPGKDFSTRFSEMQLNRVDIWWDIDHDVIWSFDEKFMKALPAMLENTRKLFAERDATKA